jgi:hypothetical protein
MPSAQGHLSRLLVNCYVYDFVGDLTALNIPVVELHKESGPEPMPFAFFHESPSPDDFLGDAMPVLQRLH